MPNLAVENNFLNYNKGYFLSAKIYSDIKSNACRCGGKFSNREMFRGYEFPVCNKCGDGPPKYRINANIVDINGKKKPITIRSNQVGERLTDLLEVLMCLKRVKQEISEGTFDVRRYDSKSLRDSFLFENFIKEYLLHHENRYERGEIKFEGLRDKKNLIRNHILPFFTGKDLKSINHVMIDNFKDSFTTKLRTRDKALAEIKTILKYAYKKEKIFRMPHFDKIPRSKERENVATIELVKKVINHVDPYYQDAFKIMAIYPIRPCELRSLRWIDIDFTKGTITIQRHFSGKDEVKGRKSLSDSHAKSSITYPLTAEAREILNLKPIPFDKNMLIFPSKINEGMPISHSTLPENWNRACKKAGVESFNSYEIKHARITEITELSDGNMVEVMAASGHTNINTVMRYSKTKTKLEEIFR